MWLDSRAAVIDLESLHANEGERRLLLKRGDVRQRFGSLATVLLSIAVAVAAKGMAMHGIIHSENYRTSLSSLANFRTSLSPEDGMARMTMLDGPDEKALRNQLGRVWVRRRDSVMQQSSVAGGPGMPLAASKAQSPEELKHRQFHKVLKQRSFRDFVVDARTGMPIDMTPDQKWSYRREKAVDLAKEEAELQAMDFFQDRHIATKYIYPDGEDVLPRVMFKMNGMMDRHVGADGQVTLKRGRVFGVFRAGAFDHMSDEDANITRFGKVGEEIGFFDRPLPIKEVDYKALKERKEHEMEEIEAELEAKANATHAENGTNVSMVFCSGKKCTEVWGQVGAGDRIVKLDDGEVVNGYEGVGPGQQLPGQDWQEQMDRHIDPRSGEELPYCVGPQCPHEGDEGGFTFDLSKWLPSDIKGEPVEGTSNLGAALPNDPQQSPQDRLAIARQNAAEAKEDDFQPPNAKPYAMDPAQKSRYDAMNGGSGEGWEKHWNTASWMAFIFIGPILTTVVSVFVFMTRGPSWGLFIFLTLVVLDVLMFYFG